MHIEYTSLICLKITFKGLTSAGVSTSAQAKLMQVRNKVYYKRLKWLQMNTWIPTQM